MKKSNKKILKEIGKISLTTLVLFIAIAIWANSGSEPEVTTPKYNNSYMQEVRSEYMGGCTEGDNSVYIQDYCTCSFDYLKLTMGDSQFIRELISYEETNEMSSYLDSSMDDAIDYCL